MKSKDTCDAIYRRYGNAVYRVALRAVSRNEVAEEIASEAFLELHRQWDSIPDDALPAWLFTVARRRAADYWRRQYLEAGWQSQVHQSAGWKEPELNLSDLLRRCSALKPVHRMCLTLRFAQGMSRTEIAEHLRLSELQVKGHLQYALRLLREQYAAPSTQATGELERNA
jgi:RNA polymerase sigma-70 factor (ECF subfamily)